MPHISKLRFKPANTYHYLLALTLTVFTSQVMSDENIITGRNTSDTITYWNCEILNTQTSETRFSNHHVRFWNSGFGRSGQTSFTWQAGNTGELSIVIDGSPILMTGVSTGETTNSTGDSVKSLSMSDSNGDVFSCELVGPQYSEGPIDQPLFDEPLPLLDFHLSAGSNTSWQCNTQNGSTVFHQSSFNVNSDGKMSLNGIEGSWFIDCLLYTSPSPRDRG